MEGQKLIPLDLSVLSEEIVEALLLDSTAEPSLLNEIAQKNAHRPKVLHHLLTHPQTPESTRQSIARTLGVPVPKVTVEEKEAEEDVVAREHRAQSLLQRIQKMKVGEKIQLALRGSRDIRSILLRDTNKEVVQTVLDNPKITDSEIEILVKQRTTPDEVLRSIAKKREWLKNYSIVHALVTNPKTPMLIAIRNMRALRPRDLAKMEKDRNLSEAIRALAKKMMTARRAL